MPFSPASPNDYKSQSDLDLEDFRRLGVRPFEYRQTVIRLAALRTTRSLAREQLTTPSEQGSLQLSRVMTSAYRLLDPRQRDDPVQRMFVGRILPHALTVAGQTRFLSDHQDDRHDVAAIESLTAEDDSIEDLSEETELQPKWTISLNEEDLVAQRPIVRVIKRVHRRSHVGRLSYLWISLALGGVVICALVGARALKNRRVLVQNRTDSVATEPRDKPVVRSMKSEPKNSSHESTEEARRHAEPKVEPPPSSSQPGIDLPATDLPVTSQPASEDPPSRQPPVILVAPMVEITRPDPAENEPPPQEEIEEVDLLQRYPIPSDDDIRAARRSLVTLVPILSESVDIESIDERMDQISDFAGEQTVGSVEHWTAIVILGEHRWLIEEVEQVAARLTTQTDRYETNTSTVLANTFIQSCTLARLPATQEHLFASGLRLCDWLLVNESIDQCQQVVETLTELDGKTNQGDTAKRLQDYSKSIQQMNRFLGATTRWIQREDKSKVTKDAGIAGRYYCLMLRRWDSGLPWLAEVSDPQISRLALQELETNDVGSRISIARRWIKLAKQNKGRIASSMQLHGVDILQRSLDESTAIKRLEIEREIDQILQSLPQDLRPSPVGEPLTTADPENQRMTVEVSRSPK